MGVVHHRNIAHSESNDNEVTYTDLLMQVEFILVGLPLRHSIAGNFSEQDLIELNISLNEILHESSVRSC